ncbi:MAG: DUF1684 domain-containing protein [Chloroflexi bacterium]|nr:DUF1684 domain-containing protein [Chloroflexota bacterium]
MGDAGSGPAPGNGPAPGWEPGDGSAEDRTWLADWRRRIAALYVEVRDLATADPMAALDHWRAVRERLFREHPQSPVPAAERGSFRARHFDHDPALRFIVRLEAEPGPDAGAADPGSNAGPAGSGFGGLTLELPVRDGKAMRFDRIGRVVVPFPAGERSLAVYWMGGYAGGLFIPFRDATNGRETYGAGRYAIDAAKSADLGGDPTDGTFVLDLNFAFQPSCAFDPRWACPLASPENRLDLEVRAGERLA